MQASNRMVLNTIVMYVRYIITMGVTLFSSRWILMSLGEENYGIYNLVAGLLSMLMFLNVALASSTQRFLSYALGKGDTDLIDNTFNCSLTLHIVVSIIIFLLVEIIGVFALNSILNIPEGKDGLAMFVLHCMAISTFVTVATVPFNASLLSHENILFYSIVQITEAVLKLILAYYLLSFGGERLKLYSVSIMAITILTTTIIVVFCRINYNECKLRIKRIKDTSLVKNLLAYSSWNLIGATSSLCRFQGVSMMLNAFFGVVINAAYGIATQVNGQLQFFSNAIITAVRPQIVKSEGGNNRSRMHALSFSACKITFLLLATVSIPLIVDMSYVLRIWLKDVPEHTVLFTQLFIVFNLATQLSVGVSIGIESVGNIKALQLLVGTLHFLVLPIGYVLLQMGFKPESVIVALIIEELTGVLIRIIISKKQTGLDVGLFLRQVIIPCLIIALFNYAICQFIRFSVKECFLRLLLICLISVCFMGTTTYCFALSNLEKEKINDILNKLIAKQKWILRK